MEVGQQNQPALSCHQETHSNVASAKYVSDTAFMPKLAFSLSCLICRNYLATVKTGFLPDIALIIIYRFIGVWVGLAEATGNLFIGWGNYIWNPYFFGGRLSKLGTPSGSVWYGCISQVKMAAFASKVLGSSNVPTFTIMACGRAGLSVPMPVPQLLQKCRVTGVSRSALEKVLAAAEV